MPNKYPAFLPGSASPGRQEVVVHTPRHVRSLADLRADELDAVSTAWRERAVAARAGGSSYLQALVNEGRLAGSSLPHSHSQLVWLDEEPPALERERIAGAGCRLCELLAEERSGDARVVLEESGIVLLCPAAGRAPYELLAAPLACEPDAFASGRLEAALHLSVAGIVRLHAVAGRVPLNLWLHTSGFGGSGLHWHIEVLPRVTMLAGLELGAELYVNQLAPEDAAAALRRP